MARHFVPQLTCFPYHMTGRCPNREPFDIPISDVWKICEDYLYLANKKYDLQIQSFVLMPNHFHLIGSSLDYPVGIVMGEFMTNTSKEINRISGRINQNWGGRYYKCVIQKPLHHLNAYKYVYQNPVRAGLCDRVEDWKFSTLRGILGAETLVIPVIEDVHLFTPEFSETKLEWLNTKIENAHLEGVRKALAKKIYKLPKVHSQRQNPLEYTLI